MRESVEKFLIRILRNRSIPGPEREAIERHLMRAEADLKSLSQGRAFGRVQLTEAA